MSAQAFGLPQAILTAFLNKSPKEGPRYVPMAFSFATTTSWGVDLTQYVQGGQLSAVQCFFIDNSQNSEPVEIAMGIGGGQVIQLDAGQQGWVTCLQNNNPQFTVTSTGTTCNIFACNFQMFNAVWYAKAGAGAAEAVNLSEVGGAAIALGAAPMAASLPVTFATNQTPLPVRSLGSAANSQMITLPSNAAVAFGTDAATFLNSYTVHLDGYTLSSANALAIHDGSGNVLASVIIPPMVSASTTFNIYVERNLDIAMSNGATAPSAILGSAPTAGQVNVILGYT